MSSKNNINPAHYKVAGRLRQGEDILHDQNKREYSQAKIALGRTWGKGESKTPLPTAKSSGRARSGQTRPSREAAEERARRADGGSEQLSGKRGTRSSAKKRESSRHNTRPMPATAPVAGAFGKTGRLSEVEEEIIQTESHPESGRDDFAELRKKGNRRARK